MRYRVSFLDDEQFERLPGKDMEEKIGVAYPETGEAFVRKSGSNVVDLFTAAHELEHLEGNSLKEHFDSENGCYYKNLGNALGPIGTVVGSMFGMPEIGGALGQIGSSMFGQGPKQQQSQMQMPNFNFQPPTTLSQNSPNIIYPQGMGGTGGSGAGGSVSSPGASSPSLGSNGNSLMNNVLNASNGFFSNRNPMAMFG